MWRCWAPPPVLTLSAWASAYGMLPSETSAEPGKWRPYPYQVGIMDAFTDPTVERITVMKSRRVGYTKILGHAIGYSIHQDPAPVLVVQPTVEDAEDYGKDELEPMFRDVPELGRLVSEHKSRNIENTLSRKRFPGGQLILTGANAPRGFRRVTAKRVFFDEVDGYPTKGAGVEGDQIELGIGRSDTFADRKIALGSTPTVKGASRIEASFEQSDRRFYFVPCPHCAAEQVLRWERMTWPPGEPEKAAYRCEHCEEPIEHSRKRWMVERGVWRATAPFKGHAGFHIWAGYSYSPQATWAKLAQKFEEATKYPGLMKTFVNQLCAETYEDEGERPQEGSLLERREEWKERPEGVLFTTLGVDVQGDRLELELVGWGFEEESWSLEYRVFRGDPGGAEVWKDLAEYIEAEKPAATCVDSGGHHTQEVYAFCREHQSRRVYAIKGAAGAGRTVWPRLATRAKKGGKVFVIGVDAAKDTVYSRLRIQKQGPGYCHFPKERDDAWIAGLISETVITKYSNGFPVREYKLRPGARNEPLDCRVYAYAALCSFGRVSWKGVVAKREESRKAAEAKKTATVEQTPEVKPQRQAPKRAQFHGTNFVTGWRR